jgi:hypothetical protein
MTDEMNKVNPVDADVQDPMLQSALKDFRASVHAWSNAAYNRPRPAISSAPQKVAWRRAAAWVLSLTLSFGILGAAAYERHHRQVVAEEQQRQQQEMDRQRALAEQRAKETAHTTETAKINETEDALLANIERAVSRQVPSAMEPLALTSDEIQ